MDDNFGEWVESMGVTSGWNESMGVASGWNLWVWLEYRTVKSKIRDTGS